MSCYEWERGTIKLPSSETVRVKAAVRDAVTKHFDDVLRLSKECYTTVKAAGKRGAGNALKMWGYDRVYGQYGSFDWSGPEGTFKSKGVAYNDAREIVQQVCNIRGWGNQPTTEIKFRTPTVADVAKFIGERPTNRTTSFSFEDATISFAGNSVTWAVSENNHARDRAHDHFIAQAFFKALDRVKWTRGSGGVIVGNDEYNRDTDYEGGGANYVISSFGPETARQRQLARSSHRW